MSQFLVPEQHGGGKINQKAKWGLHLGVSEERRGWQLLDIANNCVVTTSDVVFYEDMSLGVWKLEYGPASGQSPPTLPKDTSMAMLPLLAEVGKPAAEDVEDDSSPSLPAPPLVADRHRLAPVSASGDKGRSGASTAAPAKSIAGGRRDVQEVDVSLKLTPAGEEQEAKISPTVVKAATVAPAGQQPTGEQAAVKPTMEQSATRQSAEEPTTGEKSACTLTKVQQDDKGSKASDDGGDAEESTNSDVVEVQPGPRQSRRVQRPPDFIVPAAFTMVNDMDDDDDLLYDDAEEDEEFP
ncbi:unnamed protein product [Closterium sp. NIES-53]